MSIAWDGEPDFIRGDRRKDRRYDLDLPVRYRRMTGKGWSTVADGRVKNISSGGVVFTAGEKLTPRTKVELVIHWPPPGLEPLDLTILGQVVWCRGNLIAVQAKRREFRPRVTEVNYTGATC